MTDGWNYRSSVETSALIVWSLLLLTMQESKRAVIYFPVFLQFYPVDAHYNTDCSLLYAERC